jgi:hypothetical protein
MSGRKSKLFAAILALVLNIAGGPMTWAPVVTAGAHDVPSDAMSAMEHCPGHSNAGEGATDTDQAGTGDHSSCCDGGTCPCGCLQTSLDLVRSFWQLSIAPASTLALAVSVPPHKPFDDPFRPPIA